MPNGQPAQLANLRPVPIHLRPDHRELSAKGGRAKSLAQRYAKIVRKISPQYEAKDETKLNFYAELATDKQISDIDLLRLGQELYPTLKSEHAKVQMLQTFVSIAKQIHGEKIKTENIHHIVNWDNFLHDVFPTTTKRDPEEVSEEAI